MFWCATYYVINTANERSGATIYSQYPVCNKKQIESIPIFGDEIDEHEYYPKANINHK
jgi:hypothetical protein